MLELTGAQKRELRGALIQAFPSWNELRRLTLDQLNLNLAEVTAQGSSLEDNVFDLINWAAARGELDALILAARNQNPGNARVEDFAQKIGLSSGGGVPRAVLEKVVGSNTAFLDVAKWRAELTRAEWRVCRVDRQGNGIGTGFLVGPDLVITNYHVVEALIAQPSDGPNWSCRFDHKLAESGDVISMGSVVKLAADWKVDAARYSAVDLVPDPKPRDPADDELDFALLRLAEKVGDRSIGKSDEAEPRGWIKLTAQPVDFAQQRVIAILQHPRTLPMKLALSMDQRMTVAAGGKRLRYTVPTEPGSSGSPVFDGDWNLVALHHSGDPRIARPTYNEAIPAAMIASRAGVAAAIG